ncbi:hypothetical protein, partial [Vibrio parahaemolyticus]|uniref:hypothetical protein n=2 Tax=Vibrio parahaemolyticus TaxID=670 RepID=UPI001174C2F7
KRYLKIKKLLIQKPVFELRLLNSSKEWRFLSYSLFISGGMVSDMNFYALFFASLIEIVLLRK